MTRPCVAVLGTGPSGLAAAKALLELGLSPVVFEAAANAGGMWEASGRGAWSDFARTNISRYSCVFSDLAWPADSDVFPIRRDLMRYLRHYADAFDLLRHVRFGTQVTAVCPEGDGRWRIDWQEAAGRVGAASYDHVVIASGFFTTPFIPAFPGLSDFAGKVLHSSACDSTAMLREQFTGKRVLVVGAAFSGTEIASELASMAHVTVTLRHPMWFLPRWVPATEGGPHYPLDLVIYNRRDDNPMLGDRNLFLRRVGGDPGAASPELAFDRGPELPATIIISDEFLDLVRNRALQVKRSATLRFDRSGVTYADGTTQALDAVILGTGFSAELPFLDRTVLNRIDFDARDQLQPKLLHRNMFHPDLPGLSFIGHYRGPNFPIMELQSRWIALILAGEQAMPDRAAMLAGIAQERAVRTQFPRPQFPHGDFVGLADGLAKEIGAYPLLSEADPLFTRVMRGPVVPAQFRLSGPGARAELARAMIAATPAPVLDDPPETPGPVIAGRRLLELLLGLWAIQREITPGGNFRGVAKFLRRSADSVSYREAGTLTLDDGGSFPGENGYVYALRNGVIEISFAEGPSRGVRFIDISLPGDQSGMLPIISEDRHLCRLDTYDATFHMARSGEFRMTYVVHGPKKAYVSRSIYRRLDGSV
jgi:dimethylaniline monooxygenase (N-oxide forming)